MKIGDLVRFNHERDGGPVHRVVSVMKDGMIEIHDMGGYFAPHLFVIADDVAAIPPDIVVHQRRAREFAETEVGKALQRFESTHSRYWQQDSNDRISDRRLRELHEAAEKARAVLIALLRPLVGLEP